MDGKEDLWIKDPDLGVDSLVSASEMSGSFVSYLLPSRDGGWRELPGDVGARAEVRDAAVGACAGI